jgi:hypothetical protein
MFNRKASIDHKSNTATAEAAAAAAGDIHAKCVSAECAAELREKIDTFRANEATLVESVLALKGEIGYLKQQHMDSHAAHALIAPSESPCPNIAGSSSVNMPVFDYFVEEIKACRVLLKPTPTRTRASTSTTTTTTTALLVQPLRAAQYPRGYAALTDELLGDIRSACKLKATTPTPATTTTTALVVQPAGAQCAALTSTTTTDSDTEAPNTEPPRMSSKLLEDIMKGRASLKATTTPETTTPETTTPETTTPETTTPATTTTTTSETEAPSPEKYATLTDGLMEEVNFVLALLQATTTTTDVAHEACSPSTDEVDTPPESLRAMLERIATERRRSICGTDNENVGYESSDDQSWLDD